MMGDPHIRPAFRRYVLNDLPLEHEETQKNVKEYTEAVIELWKREVNKSKEGSKKPKPQQRENSDKVVEKTQKKQVPVKHNAVLPSQNSGEKKPLTEALEDQTLAEGVGKVSELQRIISDMRNSREAELKKLLELEKVNPVPTYRAKDKVEDLGANKKKNIGLRLKEGESLIVFFF